MTSKQSGFTLIELIAVLVILGILAATAVPRFIDLSGEAQIAAVSSLAGSLESASALNHAVDIAREAGLTSDPFTNLTSCVGAEALLSKALETKYLISGDDSLDGTTKEIGACTLEVYALDSSGSRTGSALASASFAIIAADGGSTNSFEP